MNALDLSEWIDINYIPSQLVFIGFGMVARTVLAILIHMNSKLLNLPILIIEQKKIFQGKNLKYCKPGLEDIYTDLLDGLNAKIIHAKMSRENYLELFDEIRDGAIVIELAYRLETAALVDECNKRSCVYVNTSIDTWDYNNETLYQLKQDIISKVNPEMTAVFNHGMNPGLVSHFTKHLLQSLSDRKLNSKKDYSETAQDLGLTLIQIAERDTQQTSLMTSDKCFYNTWSVVGLIDEAILPAEISWGTHECKRPVGCKRTKCTKIVQDKKSGQIVLPLPSYQVRTKSYEPKGGEFTGYCIPHAEAYSIANFLRTKSYMPSVYYSYLLPDTAKLLTHYLDYSLDKDHLPSSEHVLRSDEISDGYDSVGILAFFRESSLKKYWIGSIVSNDFAKSISGEVNATSIQVAISVLACVEWMIRHPYEGILEPEDLDTDFVLEFCRDWLGEFYIKDVSEECTIDSDCLSDLLVMPKNILF